MPDAALREEVLRFGADARLFGILTLPSAQHHAGKLPVFVFLNSGFLHRVGPGRLYVRLARTLAKMGFISFRIDLAGRGDSAGKAELRSEPSLLADYKDIVQILEARLGASELVLTGLCSGADNALMIAPADRRVIGLLLMDPTVYPDRGFRVRQLFRKFTNRARYVEWLRKRFRRVTGPRAERAEEDQLLGSLTIGELPTLEQLRAAFRAICARQGRALAVFTGAAEDRMQYNHAGQLGRVLELADYEQHCTERFLATASHTFELEQHRRQFLEEVRAWAAGFLEP